MKKTNTKPRLIKNIIHKDKRGYLIETYNEKNIMDFKFSLVTNSKKNVFRGLHYQKKYPQAILIFVIKGRIKDYCLDIRKNSQNFGKLYQFYAKENQALYIPKGFAHGYKSIGNENILIYYMDNLRKLKYENGYRHKNINYNKLIISEKDKKLPFFNKKR